MITRIWQEFRRALSWLFAEPDIYDEGWLADRWREDEDGNRGDEWTDWLGFEDEDEK